MFHKKKRVPHNDQLDKLRENLKGNALKRVPESIKSLDIAWKNLSEAFGSPMVVLKERLKSLTKLGSIPPDSNPSKQIGWFLEFESAMQEIIDLGTSDDLNMQVGAFGPPVQETVLKAFNDNPQKKREVAMSGLNLQPREKMVAYQSKIQTFRKEVQLAEVESGSLTDKRRPAVALTAMFLLAIFPVQGMTIAVFAKRLKNKEILSIIHYLKIILEKEYINVLSL